MLARHGISAERVDWADPRIDWSSYQLSVFRSTWDYFHRWGEFQRWLGDVQQRTKLCNSPPLIAWNVDKHYLGDLALRGIPVVPTRYIERGSLETLRELLDATGWDHAVLKPCISARLAIPTASIARISLTTNRSSATCWARNR